MIAISSLQPDTVAGGVAFMGTAITWNPPDNLFQMTGRRVQGTVVNGRLSASFFIPQRDLFLAPGGWVLTAEPDPGWWNVTEAQARASIGLPP